jgi:hypothetical protein
MHTSMYVPWFDVLFATCWYSSCSFMSSSADASASSIQATEYRSPKHVGMVKLVSKPAAPSFASPSLGRPAVGVSSQVQEGEVCGSKNSHKGAYANKSLTDDHASKDACEGQQHGLPGCCG